MVNCLKHTALCSNRLEGLRSRYGRGVNVDDSPTKEWAVEVKRPTNPSLTSEGAVSLSNFDAAETKPWSNCVNPEHFFLTAYSAIDEKPVVSVLYVIVIFGFFLAGGNVIVEGNTVCKKEKKNVLDSCV